jgi:hypothetical protein
MAYLACSSLDTFPSESPRASDDPTRCSAQGGFRSLKLSRQPGHRVQVTVNDWERRLAALGRRSCVTLRVTKDLYIIVFS